MGYESFWPGVFAVVLFTFIVNCAAQVQVEIERPTAKTTGKPITPRNSSTTTASNSSASFNLGIMAKAGMVPLFKNAQSEYFISNYETDAVSAREACEDLGEGFHLLLIENYEELAQLREHVGKRTEGQIEPVWTAGERDINSTTFWNAPNKKRLAMNRQLFRDFDEFEATTAMALDSLPSLLSRKSRDLESRRRPRTTTRAPPKIVTMKYGNIYGDDDGCEENVQLPAECQQQACNVSEPVCTLGRRPECETQIMQTGCDPKPQNCTAKCENCTVVVEPQCYAEPQNCTVDQGQCKAYPGKCEVEHPPCIVRPANCTSYQPPCQNVTIPVSCTTRKPCIDDCESDCPKCKGKDEDCKCKVDICREEQVVCPSPITHCPPPEVFCPEPIVNCTDKPIIECPEPVVNCPDPIVTCTTAQVICTPPIVTCTPVVTTCNRPSINCPRPEAVCTDPVVTCPEPKPCPPAPSSPPPCCEQCACACIDRDSKQLEFQKCKRKHRFVCEAPRN